MRSRKSSLFTLLCPEHLSCSLAKSANPPFLAPGGRFGSPELCFPQVSRPKASPPSFQEGVTLREGEQEFPGHTKAYSAHKGYLPSQSHKSLPGSRCKSRTGTGLLIHGLADLPLSIISSLGKMPPGWGETFVSR